MDNDKPKNRNQEHGFSKSDWKGVEKPGKYWRNHARKRAPKHHFHGNFRWRGQAHDKTHMPPIGDKQRGLFFIRFLGAFALIIILILGGMAAFAFLLSKFYEGSGRMAALVWVLGCSLSLALPLLAAGIARAVFHGMASPIADIMAATEAIAQGDLDVRVPITKQGPRDFRRLTESFNHMITQLALLDQQRRNLTADVAHELRTPLHIIQGNLEGILDGVYQPSSEQINSLLDETRLLTRLVQDLQTLSMADSLQLALNIESVDILELLNDILISFSGQAEAARISMQLEILDPLSITEKGTAPKSTHIVVNADPSRLDQVINNLIANALYHTKEGGNITLRAKKNPQWVIIQVADTGEGISEQDLPFIFDRFWKGDRSRERTGTTGSGLGLAISRKLVETHGGLIDVESKLGQGTTFTIKLPND